MISAGQAALGESFELLPAEVRALHRGQTHAMHGTADVKRSKGLLQQLLCSCMGLPQSGDNQTVRLDFEAIADGRSRWRRDFAGRKYQSILSGEGAGRLIERMGRTGLITNIFQLTATGKGLTYRIVGMRFLGITLPAFLHPTCDALESSDNGVFTFDISIDMPRLGNLIRYSGRLK